jgi:hypothetical protein
MNGMSYQLRTFTLPASNSGTSQLKWDMAFLTDAEFKKKYGTAKSV